MRTGDANVSRVQKQHEDARIRVGQHRARLGDRVRLAPRVLRHVASNDDVLEGVDLLRNLVFEYFEVVCREVGDRHAVLGREHVHANVVRFGLEGWTGLILRMHECGMHECQNYDRTGDEPKFRHFGVHAFVHLCICAFVHFSRHNPERHELSRT